jgi:hypothetical protein
MGGHAGATQLGRNVLPSAARHQDEPENVEYDTMADARPATLQTNGLLGRR